MVCFFGGAGFLKTNKISISGMRHDGIWWNDSTSTHSITEAVGWMKPEFRVVKSGIGSQQIALYFGWLPTYTTFSRKPNIWTLV